MARHEKKKRVPDHIDRHVASRFRARRLECGLTQEQMAEELDLTFQQVQKYEKGVNRLSASTLFRSAAALAVPPGYFFKGLRA